MMETPALVGWNPPGRAERCNPQPSPDYEWLRTSATLGADVAVTDSLRRISEGVIPLQVPIRCQICKELRCELKQCGLIPQGADRLALKNYIPRALSTHRAQTDA